MSAFLLKLIALLSMIVDHSGVVFQPLFDVPLYSLCRGIGRIAFPMFLFFIAEGCRRSHNIKLFILRLGIFALISELPFDLALAKYTSVPTNMLDFSAYNFSRYQNVFFTFFLGALCVYIYQTFKDGYNRLIYIVLIPIIVYCGDLFHTDYGSAGVLSVFILYILPYGSRQDGKPLQIDGSRQDGKPLQMSEKGKFYRIAALFCLLIYLYIIKYNIGNMTQILSTGGFWALLERLPQVLPESDFKYMLFSCLSLVLLTFYNYKRGRPQRWLLYAANPVHLGILGIVRYLYVLPKIAA